MDEKKEARLRLLERFRESSVDRVTGITSGWVTLEQSPDEIRVADEVARQLHTLKGETRTLGLQGLLALAEPLEELFHRSRQAAFRVPAPVGDSFLAGMDAFGAILLLPLCEGALDPALLEGLAASIKEVPALLPAAAPVATAERPRGARAADAPRREEWTRVLPSRIEALSELALELRVGQSQEGFVIAKLRSRVEQLASLVNDLRTTQEGEGSVRTRGLTDEAQAAVRALLQDSHQLEEVRHQQELQMDALNAVARELRLVPLSSLLVPYSRSVRDMAADLGKQATLTIEGDELEADKRVLEALNEPLLHLLRNAVDHGIESPEERVKRGKPISGQIRLVARQPQPGQIALSLEDDGAGLDPRVLRRTAVERKVVSDEAAATLNDEDALQLIFQPGFSTRTAVGALSGRGVGMEIVKQRVSDLGGTVALDNRPGVGLRTTLTMPISISLSRVLLVRVAGRTVALPASGVERAMRIEESQVREGPRGLLFKSGDELIPLVGLGALLGLPSESTHHSLALVLRSGAERMAASVGQILGEAELAVRPLERPLRSTPGVSGASVLSSGQMVLVLNVSELLRWGHERRSDARPSQAAASRRALVVDDSFVFRNLVADLLTGLGFEVTEAEDGRKACEALAAQVPDLLVTDLQMPHLDGFELMQRVRSHASWRHLPILAVSTLSSPSDRQRALQAGANAFLLKSALDRASMARVLEEIADTGR